MPQRVVIPGGFVQVPPTRLILPGGFTQVPFRPVLGGVVSAGATSFVGPLDAYSTSIQVAVLPFRGFSAYAGPWVNLRESGGNTLADIGYLADGQPDTAAWTAHVAGNSGFLRRWYDQSGSSRDEVQTTSAAQPQSVLNIVNGYPVMRCDGVNDEMEAASVALSAARTLYLVIKKRSAQANALTLTPVVMSHPIPNVSVSIDGDSTFDLLGGFGWSNSDKLGGVVTDWALVSIVATDANNASGHINGGDGTVFVPTDFSSIAMLNLGYDSGDVDFGAALLYNAAHNDATREAIEAILAAEFGITLAGVGDSPTNLTVPTISGADEVGATKTATTGTFDGSPAPTLSWQWQISADSGTTWTDIAGETAATYQYVAGDSGKIARVQQTGVNEFGIAVAVSASSGVIVTTPASLPDIETWFDPASLVPLGDGALIDVWEDEMGGADATGTGAARPSVDLDGLNGAPGILFGSGDTLAVSRSTVVPWTEFVVVLPANTSSRRLITYNGATPTPYLEALNATNLTVSGSSGGTIASRSAVQFAKPYIMLRTVTATLQRFFYNQTMIGDSTTLDNFTNAITNISHPSTFAYTGHAGDYGRFSAELSDANKALLFAYLVNKYDILHNFIVCDGDSLTIGTIGVGANDNYPQQLVDDLDASYGVQRFTKYNYGVNSAEIAARAAAFAAQSGRWATHVGNGIKNIYVFWCGTNNLFSGMSAADTYTAYVSACQAAQAAGFDVCACTIMNHVIGGAGGGSWTQAAADAVNADIRANWATFADYFADIQAQPNLQDVTDLTYFLADEVHLTAAGYTVVKNTVKAALAL